jgi:hypothetical protein
MTLNEMDKKVLSLIEELNPDSEHLTDDPDIQAKKRYVTNQIMFEMARMKKIPKYFEMEVNKGDVIDFATLEKKCGYEIYQISNVSGVSHLAKAMGTVFKVTEDGTMEVDCFVYPERITDTTSDSYEFELSPDVLEIMPYGIAADLLKSDVSAEYGNIYSVRYENMKQLLDPRYQMTSITFEGGVRI